ncbi:MAG: translation initiation factor 2 [Oscillospiraceae bacterium]
MVKGITRRVVVVKSPDPHVFDEAIFIVKEDAAKHPGVTNEEILRQAQDAAMSYVKSSSGKRRGLRLPAPVYTLIGAGMTGILWLLTAIIH